ncbi:hypothetical protein K438DRAFT_361398 [Mycena galopus ATCC 62051]|nr:hypothetical protein K438DRAFT_361398 [Mycena galopus ATCC 62051]
MCESMITVVSTVTQIISRITTRVFVGLPLCRNKEYLDLTNGHNIRVFAASQILRICPDFLKPIIAPIITTRKSAVRHALTGKYNWAAPRCVHTVYVISQLLLALTSTFASTAQAPPLLRSLEFTNPNYSTGLRMLA